MARSISSAKTRMDWRGKMDLSRAIFCGRRRTREIVYCYRFPSCPGRVKIGYSSRGLKRVAEQCTAFPEIPEILFVIHDQRARALETGFHRALRSRKSKVPGAEWFDAGWPDLTRVSPALRKATVRRRMHVRLRMAVAGVLAASGLAVYPAIASMAAGVLEGQGAQTMAPAAVDYLRLVTGLDPQGAFEKASALMGYVRRGDGWLTISAIAAVIAFFPAAVVWWRTRRMVLSW